MNTTEPTQTMTPLNKFRQVYADALDDDVPFEKTREVRSLNWRGDRTSLVSVALMYSEIKSGYNEFKPRMIADLLAQFPEGVEASPAREYSVAVYLHLVQPNLRDALEAFVLRQFHADEIDWDADTLRIWWD